MYMMYSSVFTVGNQPCVCFASSSSSSSSSTSSSLSSSSSSSFSFYSFAVDGSVRPGSIFFC